MIKLRDLIREEMEPKKEKHNPLYHQDEPVQFKKPKEVPDEDDKELPKAEKDTQDVLDRMEHQAEYSNPSSVEFFKELRDRFQECIYELNKRIADEGKE